MKPFTIMFATFIGILILVFQTTASASDDEPVMVTVPMGAWVPTTKGCQVFVAGAPPDAVTEWSGQCVSNRASGKGVLETRRGSFVLRYDGEMLDGRWNGQGTALFSNGLTVTGTWKNGLVDGLVNMKLPSGQVYSGDTVWGKPEGFGIADWPSGDHYEGNWHNGKQFGHGVSTNRSGVRYDGEFLDGLRHGHGTLRYPGGAYVEGEWGDGGIHGHVIYTNRKGDHFDGYATSTGREGPGTYLWANGDHYEGTWKNDVPDGKGTLTRSDNTTVSGIWYHGCLTSEGQKIALFVQQDTCP